MNRRIIWAGLVVITYVLIGLAVFCGVSSQRIGCVVDPSYGDVCR